MTMIMKKYISFFVTTLVLSLGFASCSVETDEPAGGTAVEDMCGHWVVTVDAYDSDGELLAEDPYEMGEWNTLTYNTANNDNNVMWLTDNSEFWDYTVKVSVDYNAKTFSCDHVYIYTNDGEDQFCNIFDGKIIKNGGTNVNGKPTDAIEYKIEFTDDPGTVYFVHGVRYAGF